MSSILIREAKETDLSTIGELIPELIETLDDTEGIDIKQVLENCQNLLRDPNSHLFVAEIDGVVVGFINFTTRKTVLHRGPSGLIDVLVVAKNYRGKGIGKQLLSAAIEKCKQLGCCEVEVSTEKVNTKAKKFYRKCGFNEREVLLEVGL
mgnify:CR=1 FL=1